MDEGFILTIWRPSADTVHDTIHEPVRDISSTFTEIAELTHRLVLVIHGEMSRTQLMEILELKNRSHFSISYLESALKEELIEMTLPGKSKSKNQKYRLTTKGLVLKERLTSRN